MKTLSEDYLKMKEEAQNLMKIKKFLVEEQARKNKQVQDSKNRKEKEITDIG